MTKAIRKFHSRFGVIRLRYDKRERTLTYLQKGGYQSSADGNGTSVETYVHALYGLALQHPGRRVLIIGCGGGTLATMLARAGRRVSVVDIDPLSFRLAKRYFQLPASVVCHLLDGLTFLQKTRRRYDVLILDAFVGENIPAHMRGPAFFAAALRRLRPRGMILVNVCVDNKADRTADRIAAEFKGARRTTRILDMAGQERNTIVMAGNVGRLRRPRLMLRVDAVARHLKRQLNGLRFRRLRGGTG